MVRTERVYREWELFYKKGQKFKWHLRPTMIDCWRQYQASRHPRYSYSCPKTPRVHFREDYKVFKETWWDQDIYLQVLDTYDSDTTTWQFSVIMPVYKIERGRIVEIYNVNRGRYPTNLLILEPIDNFPREDWDINPDEKFSDIANINWRDSNMFVALRWFQVPKDKRNLVELHTANMTWIWHYLPNNYNAWYDYKDWRLVEHTRDERDIW